MCKIKRLHVFSDDYTWVVAYDKEDAKKVYEEWCGEYPEDDCEGFEQLSDFTTLIINYEDIVYDVPLFCKTKIVNEMLRVTAKCWQWILKNGRGYLCSDNW